MKWNKTGKSSAVENKLSVVIFMFYLFMKIKCTFIFISEWSTTLVLLVSKYKHLYDIFTTEIFQYRTQSSIVRNQSNFC